MITPITEGIFSIGFFRGAQIIFAKAIKWIMPNHITCSGIKKYVTNVIATATPNSNNPLLMLLLLKLQAIPDSKIKEIGKIGCHGINRLKILTDQS